VFKETPAGELIEANCHARLNCLKQLLDDIIFIQFNDKKVITLATSKKLTEQPTAATKDDNGAKRCLLCVQR